MTVRTVDGAGHVMALDAPAAMVEAVASVHSTP